MDIRLTFGKRYGVFILALLAPTKQITIEFVLQKLFHFVATVLFFHNHQSRILRETLRQHFRALNISANKLMRPPLVCELMSCYIKRRIDVVFFEIINFRDKPNRFRVGNCIWKRLCKRCIAWKFDNTVLLVLIGSKIFREVI